MARPRKGEELGASSTIGVRVTAQTREAIEALARENNRSLTEEARAALDAVANRYLKEIRRAGNSGNPRNSVDSGESLRRRGKMVV